MPRPVEVCITTRNVNQALQKAMNLLGYSRPDRVDSLEPPPEQITASAEVVQRATHILAYQ